jgi:DNA modification methylase
MKENGSINDHISLQITNAIVLEEQEGREKVEDQVILHSQKPLKLMKELICSFTTPGQLVYCPCSGTGKYFTNIISNWGKLFLAHVVNT